jgi:hypothetical protein
MRHEQPTWTVPYKFIICCIAQPRVSVCSERFDFAEPPHHVKLARSLIGNGITEVAPQMFSSLTKLTELRLFANPIGRVPANAFAGLNLSLL